MKGLTAAASWHPNPSAAWLCCHTECTPSLEPVLHLHAMPECCGALVGVRISSSPVGSELSTCALWECLTQEVECDPGQERQAARQAIGCSQVATRHNALCSMSLHVALGSFRTGLQNRAGPADLPNQQPRCRGAQQTVHAKALCACWECASAAL